jgi:hypothetical protein
MKAWRLRDIERLAIQQWVADNFGQAWDGRRMERVVLLSSILEGWNLEAPLGSNRGWSFADEAEITKSLARTSSACVDALALR